MTDMRWEPLQFFQVPHVMRDDAERENVVAAYYAGAANSTQSYSYTCPNGHPIPTAFQSPCPECDALVVVEPLARGMELHRQLEAAEAARDDYKERWETLGRVTRNMLAKRETEIRELREQLRELS